LPSFTLSSVTKIKIKLIIIKKEWKKKIFAGILYLADIQSALIQSVVCCLVRFNKKKLIKKYFWMLFNAAGWAKLYVYTDKIINIICTDTTKHGIRWQNK